MCTKNYLRTLAGIVLYLSPLVVQSDQLWNDGFAGTVLNGNWSAQSNGGSSVSYPDGFVLFTQGTSTAFGRAFLTTDKTQDQITSEPAQFEGQPAFDFFAHDLQVMIRRLRMPGDVTEGTLNFVVAVTGQNADSDYGPRNGNSGAYLRVTKSPAGLQLGMMEVNNNRSYSSKQLYTMPRLIELNMNATGWVISVSGTTFTDGTTTHTGEWSNLAQSDFDVEFPSFRVGVYNEDIQTASSNEVFLDGIEILAGPNNSPVNALPRIGVREATPFAQFYNTENGEEFFPNGINYIKLHEYIQSDGSNSGSRNHATFIEELYDPHAAEVALAGMADGGFTIVRVWLYHGHWQLRANGFLSVGGPLASNSHELHQPYMDNFVDFLKRANRHGIYVHLVIDREPENSFYRRDRVDVGFEDIEGFVHREYMVEGSIEAKEIYVREIVREIRSRDPGLLSTIFTYEIRNEIHANTQQKPFSMTSGIVTTSAGDYDMGIAEERQAAYDDNVINWLNRSVAALREEDPHALITSSVFAYAAVGKTEEMNSSGLLPVNPGPDTRWPVRPSVLMATDLDFVSFHHYISSRTWSEALKSSGWDGLDKTKKPFIAGEYGIHRDATDDPFSAANQLYDHRERVLDLGFRGASLFTFDTFSHHRWAAMEDGAYIFERLKPRAFNGWDFSRTGFNAFWSIGDSIDAMNVSRGRLHLMIDGSAPFLYSPTCRIDTATTKYFKIGLKNGTGDTNAQLFWVIKDDSSWDEAKSVTFAISSNDESLKTYVIDLSGHPEWSGIVDRVRFDPIGTQASMLPYEIESFEFHQENPLVKTFADWSETAIPGAIPEEQRAPDASIGSSGIQNLHAFAFGIDPLKPKREYLPSLIIVQSGGEKSSVFHFRKNLFADLDYTLYTSENLSVWHPYPNLPIAVGLEVDGIQWMKIEEPILPDNTKRFFRLRFE